MKGYISTQYIDILSFSRSDIAIAVVKLQDPNSHLNVRSAPTTTSTIIDQFNHGQRITVYYDNGLPSGWVRVNL